MKPYEMVAVMIAGRVQKLVNAVRSFGMSVVVDERGQDKLKVGISSDEFTPALIRLQKALDELDGDGSVARLTDIEERVDKLSRGVDAVFRWLRTQGVNVESAADILAEHLGVAAEKRRTKSLKKVPSFAIDGYRRRRAVSPRLKFRSNFSFEDGDGEKLTPQELFARRSFEANAMVNMMGSAGSGPIKG